MEHERLWNERNIAMLRRALAKYPLPPKHAQRYEYGTAGFRYEASLLPPVVVRMGLLAALRSASLDGEEVGVMITASHNPHRDNGVKLIDSDGGMLHPTWEHHAMEFVNCRSDDDDEQTMRYVRSLLPATNCNSGNGGSGGEKRSTNARRAVVHIGRDTRTHSRHLSQLAASGARAAGARVIDHDAVTTPQLHFIVMQSNSHKLPNVIPHMLGESGYFEVLCRSYCSLLGTVTREVWSDGQDSAGRDESGVQNAGTRSTGRRRRRRTLVVDCACGVGHPKILAMQSILNKLQSDGWWALPSTVKLLPLNGINDGPLNDRCGAEYVQKNRLPPRIYSPKEEDAAANLQDGTACASLDGDADRIVFHYTNKRDGKFQLLDGDKIAVLVCGFVQEEIRALEAGCNLRRSDCVRCGVVQTAYANGSSTLYLKNVVKTIVITAKTGVKHVHAAAHDNFDVGVYFEANGHGTILFGPKFYDMLAVAESRLRDARRDDRASIALRRLRVLPSLVNQAVGDALSDLLLVDAILFLRDWDLETWSGLYVDMPSRQCKVRVRDRSIITTDENETMAKTPPSLQPALNSAVRALASRQTSSAKVSGTAHPRTFVRPSGTENVVRVYAEASTQRDADALAFEAATLVHTLCGGVGDAPSVGAFGSKM